MSAPFRSMPHVILTGEGSTRFLTDTVAGDIFEVNTTAALVFEAAREGLDLDAIVGRLRDAHPTADPARLALDVGAILEDFVGNGLLARVA